MRLFQAARLGVLWFAVMGFSATAHPQTLTWDGATNNNWSNDSADANWTGNAWTTGANAVFAASGAPASYSVALTDSIVAGNVVLTNDGADGVDLTLSGANSLMVNGSANLQFGPVGGTLQSAVTVDMSNLQTFAYEATANVFRIGLQTGSSGGFSPSTTVSTVTLADTNTITASQLLMSDQAVSSGGGHSYLYLGNENTINASNILIAASGRSSATMAFGAGLTAPNATFRGTSGGDSRITTWNIGRVTNYMNNTWTATVDFSEGTIDALVDTMTIGDANSYTATDRAGTSEGTFAMGDGSMDVITLNIGRVTGAGALREGSSGGFNGNGTFTIAQADAQFTAGTMNLATMNHTATGGSPAPTTTGLFNLEDGTATITAGIVLGDNTTTGTAGAVTATVRQAAGTLTIAGGLLEGSNVGGEVTSNVQLLGGTATIAGGLSTDTLCVGYNGLAADATVDSGIVRIGDGTGAGLIVGHRTDATAETSGTLDVSNADSVTIDTGTVVIAYNESTVDASYAVASTLTLSTSGANSITADLIQVGQIDSGSTGTTAGILQLGENNTINADTVIVGGDEAQGTVTVAAGGTLTLTGKSTGSATNVSIGANNGSYTGTDPAESHLNLSGGTLEATLDNLVIGQFTGTGSGSGTGRFTMDAGTVTANAVLLAHSTSQNPVNTQGTLVVNGGSFTVNGNVTGGSGTSSVEVNGGSMTVGGDLIVDTLRVGYHTSEGDATGRNASVITAGNGSVQIGSETERTNLYVGHTNQNLTEDVVGVLNLSGSASFTAYLNSFIIGQRTVGLEGYNGDAVGTVTLPDTSYIDATSIMISDQQMWIGADPSTLTLGANSTFKVNLFTVGANRANARLEFASGGTLTLGGPTGSKADLRIGYQTLGTGSTANSTADFSGGTLNATLDELVIGYANGKSNGGGKAFGTMLFSGGTVTANSVKIGDANASVGTGTGDGTLTMSGGTFTVDGDITLGTGTSLSKGAINLSAGTLSADSITQGVGTGILNFTGGTLHVDAFGSEARPFDLVQAGGTLAPGDSPGMTTIYGDYTMNAGALEIEINGLDQGDQGLVGDAGDEIGYDHVLVDGDASLTGNLNVLLLDDFAPELGSHFDVLQTTGSLDIAGLALNTDLAPLAFGWWEMGTIGGAGGEGGILRLSAVPEPSGVLLLILALLLGYARRSRQ